MTRASHCCRELRVALQGHPKVGEVLRGFNTDTRRWEVVKVVKIHSDWNQTVIRALSERAERTDREG